MALTQWIYTSTLVHGGLDVIAPILETARRVNALRSVTGMLLHANGYILQVLEGEETEVQKTFQSIEMDTRHRSVFLLSRQTIAERQFGAWTMGLRDLSHADVQDAGAAGHLFDANPAEIASRVQPGAALAMLLFFAHGMEMTG